jgi:hypothetical protein
MCKAVERATEQGERYLGRYTDSDIVVNQLMNNYTLSTSRFVAHIMRELWLH